MSPVMHSVIVSSYPVCMLIMLISLTSILMTLHYVIERNMRDTFETNNIIGHHKELLRQVRLYIHFNNICRN